MSQYISSTPLIADHSHRILNDHKVFINGGKISLEYGTQTGGVWVRSNGNWHRNCFREEFGKFQNPFV
jgi:hypothetical protein